MLHQSRLENENCRAALQARDQSIRQMQIKFEEKQRYYDFI
jgi:hypothetical protein